MNEKQFSRFYYKPIYVPDHPYASKNGTVLEYRLEVEKAIGRYLTPKEQVHHHYNKDGSVTLIACENQKYHSLLHKREEALRYSGHANWFKCNFCKQYDDPKNLSFPKGGSIYHKLCKNKYERSY